MPSSRQKKLIKFLATYVGIPCLVIVICASIIYYLVDWEGYKARIVNYAKLLTEHELQINGELEISMFPQLTIDIRDIHLKNSKSRTAEHLLSIDQAVIKYSYWELLKGNNQVSYVELGDTKLVVENHTTRKNVDWLQTIFLKSRHQQIASQPFEVSVKNATVVLMSGHDERPVRRIIPLGKMDVKAGSSQGPFEIAGGKQKSIGDGYNYTLNIGEGADYAPVNFSFQSPGIDISYGGKVRIENDEPYAEGQLDAQIQRGVHRLADSFFYGMLPADNGVAAEDTSIKADVTLHRNNITFKSFQLEDAAASLHGEVDVSISSITHITPRLEIERLNVDLLMGNVANEQAEGLFGASSVLQEGGIGYRPSRRNESYSRSQDEAFSSDVYMDMRLNIKEMQFNKETIRNMTLNAEFDHRRVVVRNMVVDNLPGKTRLEISGNETEGGSEAAQENIFNGNAYIKGDNFKELAEWIGYDVKMLESQKDKAFSLVSQFVVKEADIHFVSMNAHVGDVDAIGQLKLSFTPEGLDLSGAYNVKVLNVDSFMGGAKKEEDAIDIGTSVEHLDFLRNLDVYFNNFALAINTPELTFNNREYQNFSVSAYLKNAVLTLRNLRFESNDFGKGVANIVLDNTELRPDITVDAHFNKMNVTDLVALLDDDSDPSRYESMLIRQVPSRWSQKLFNFDELGNYTVRGTLAFDTFMVADVEFSNVKANVATLDNELKINSLSTNIGEAKLEAKGVVGVVLPSLSMTFEGVNLDAEEVLDHLFGMNRVKGKFSTSGSINMGGFSMQQWVSSMQGAVNFVSRDVTLDGFDLLLLSRKLPNLKSIKETRYWAHKSLSGGQTRVDYVAGTINFLEGEGTIKRTELSHPLIDSSYFEASLDLDQWMLNSKAYFEVKLEGGKVPVALSVDGDIDRPLVFWDKKGIEEFWARNFFRRY